MRAAMLLPMPLISPEARYSLMPSAVAGSRIHLHLPAEAGVVHPPALDAQGRARLRAAHMPDHGDEIHLVLAFRPDPEHRVAVFLIMEDHTLQRALQFHRIIEG